MTKLAAGICQDILERGIPAPGRPSAYAGIADSLVFLKAVEAILAEEASDDKKAMKRAVDLAMWPPKPALILPPAWSAGGRATGTPMTFRRSTTARCKAKATFLIIDEDTIDNGIASIELISFGQPLCGGGNPSVCVNDDIADPRDDRAGSSCL